jgi:large subunit ribosomal protein L22
MEAKAIGRYIRQSSRKVRFMADLVRGKDVEEALNQLHFSNKKASISVEKNIRSAVSNLMSLEGGAGINPEDLYIKTIFVDDAPMAKRMRPGAMGRASIIRKRSCHLTVVVAEKEKKVTETEKKK